MKIQLVQNLKELFKKDKGTVVLVLLVIYAFVISVSAVVSVPDLIGADSYFHLNIATYFSQGQFSEAWNYTMFWNQFPYPPLFHFLEVPLVWSGSPFLLARILEVFFMPVTYSLVLLMVYRFGGGSKPAIFAGLILLGGWAFMDGALQVRPESLDLLLYPIAAMALLSYKKKTFLASLAITVYGHGIAALSSYYGLGLNKWKDPKWRKTIIVAIAIVLPILIISAMYFNGAIANWGGAPKQENPQEYEFWYMPHIFIPAYAGSGLLGFAFLFKKHKSELESLLTWGVIGSAIMIPIWPDRWLQYVSIPLAALGGIGLAEMKGKKQLVIGIVVMSIYMIYFAMWMNMSFQSLWWQPNSPPYP